MSNPENRYNNQQNMVLPAAKRDLPTVRPMTAEESAAFQGLTRFEQTNNTITMPVLPDAKHSAHSKEAFDVRAMALVARLHSRDKIIVVGIITGTLATVAYLKMPYGDGFDYFAGWIVLWGSISLAFLQMGANQGYKHSPAGIAHKEQETHERMYSRAMDTEDHRIDADLEIRLAETAAKKELGLSFINRLENRRDE